MMLSYHIHSSVLWLRTRPLLLIFQPSAIAGSAVPKVHCHLMLNGVFRCSGDFGFLSMTLVHVHFVPTIARFPSALICRVNLTGDSLALSWWVVALSHSLRTSSSLPVIFVPHNMQPCSCISPSERPNFGCVHLLLLCITHSPGLASIEKNELVRCSIELALKCGVPMSK